MTAILETAERLIISEIGDYAASLGGPYAIVTTEQAEQLQQELIARVRRVFADVKQQGDCSGPDETVEMSFAPHVLQKYHTHIMGMLIDTGVVTEPAQINVLQNALNTYIYQQKAGAK